MKTCHHRGFSYEGSVCPYHGIKSGQMDCFARPKTSFELVTDDEFSRFHSSVGECFYTYSQEVKCHFSLWMQNTMDVGHLKTAHPQFADIFQSDFWPHSIGFSENKMVSRYKLNVKKNVAIRYEKILSEECPSEFYHLTGFPNFSATSFLNVFFSIEHVKDLGPNLCRVDTTFYTRKGLHLPDVILAAARKANEVVLLQDKQLMERWAPTARVTGNWLPGEDRIRVYNELLQRERA